MALSKNIMLSLRALAILVISLVIVFIVGNMQETFLNPDLPITNNNEAAQTIVAFEGAECKPECCPGEFSCSHGCVCLTKDQKNDLMLRGNNRSTRGDTTY